VYEAHVRCEGGLVLTDLCEKYGWDTKIFTKAERRLLGEGLIAYCAMSAHDITPLGAIYCEDNKIEPEELSVQNNRVRRLLLEILSKANEEGDQNGAVYFEDILEKSGFDKELMMVNLQLLVALNYINSSHPFLYYKISKRGIVAHDEWCIKNAIANEFASLSTINPQSRGRAFQKVVAKIFERFGWLQDEGVRTSHEEMDVIVYRDREYYLVECKWENEPIGAAVIRELHGKLSNRADIRGIVVSMSGFTEGAAMQVKDYASNRVILLFGAKDINSLIHGESAFDALLNYKYKELITRKKVVFD
jgi:hypothetical protein